MGYTNRESLGSTISDINVDLININLKELDVIVKEKVENRKVLGVECVNKELIKYSPYANF